VIIPNQRKVVKALIAGEEPEARLGQQARQRSLHNNYLTLPVVFIMISNHYPLTFAVGWGWLIVALILIAGFAVRHFFNERHKGRPSPWWTWGVAAAAMALVAWIGSRRADDEMAAAPPTPPTFAMAEEVVAGRCSACHAAEPVWEGIVAPPKGVMLDTPERIRAHAGEIARQSVWSDAMPPGNITEITPEERAILAAWVRGGAPGE
jgi:uncharacterized membrane protein